MPENLYMSHTLETTSSNGEVISSGTLTTWEDNPTSTLNVGDTFRPVPGGPLLTVKKVSINDNVIGLNAGHPVRQWQVSVEGSDEASAEAQNTPDKHSFVVEQNDDDVIHSGTLSVVSVGDNPPSNLQVGSFINFPGAGRMKCSKISGSDEVDENGRRIWNITYEGTDAPSSGGDTAIPQTKYSFSIDDANSGSMQVVNEGNSPALTLSVGSTFNIPGIGNVKCTKISGSDEYTEAGVRRWTVTYEGSDAEEASSAEADNVKYSFSVEDGVNSGTKQVTQYGDTPVFTHTIGTNFNIPGVGSVPCTKIDGSDEYTDDGRHKWTISYQSSLETSTSSSEETLPQTKFNLAIEKDNDGVLQKSGSMSVASNGNSPTISVAVGDNFNIPGLGNVTCTKISGNDSYSDSGSRIWTMTYEGSLQSGSQGGGETSTDNNVRYSYTKEKTSDGKVTNSGHIEISVVAANPPSDYSIGSNLNIPGVGDLKCTKISGSDSYTENGNRKWTVVFEGADETSTSGETSESGTVRYSHSTERDSNGILSTTVSKQYSVKADNLGNVPEVGDSFSIPGLLGPFTCTKVTKENDGSDSWSITLEGSSSGGDSGSDEGDTSTLPETEISSSQEINGITTRSVSGEFIVLRRSQTPITRKNITLYTDDNSSGQTVGEEYEGGTITSISTSKETIKNNNVVTKTYYKHVIEVEA